MTKPPTIVVPAELPLGAAIGCGILLGPVLFFGGGALLYQLERLLGWLFG